MDRDRYLGDRFVTSFKSDWLSLMRLKYYHPPSLWPLPLSATAVEPGSSTC